MRRLWHWLWVRWIPADYGLGVTISTRRADNGWLIGDWCGDAERIEATVRIHLLKGVIFVVFPLTPWMRL